MWNTRLRLGLSWFLLIFMSAPLHAETITIRADPWLPYNGMSSKPPQGYMIDLADRIAKANGHRIEYGNLPWDDALDAVRKGQFDCVAGAAIDDADDFAFPEASWGKSQNAFFVMQESKWRYTGIDSLASVRLAVIDAYSYSEDLDAYIAAHRDDGRLVIIKPVRRATVSAVSQLVTERADVVVEDINVMSQTLATLQMTDRVINAGTGDERTDVYIACTPATPRGKELAKMFSDGLVALRASGELQKVLDNYGLKDWFDPKSPE